MGLVGACGEVTDDCGGRVDYMDICEETLESTMNKGVKQ